MATGNRYRIRVLVRNARKSISFPFIITVYKARGKLCELTKKFDAPLVESVFFFQVLYFKAPPWIPKESLEGRNRQLYHV